MKFSSLFTITTLATLTLVASSCKNAQEPGFEDANLTEYNSSTGTNGSAAGNFGTGGIAGASDFTTEGLNNSNDPNNWTRMTDHPLPSIYFATDANTLGQAETTELQNIAKWVQQAPDVGLIIEANCDERGTEEYNRALGERRALAVKDFLQSQGLAPERIHTLSFGEDKPKAQGQTEEAFQENRRADIIPAKIK